VNGILVPPGDRDAIVNAITKLLQDEGLRNRLVTNARKKFLENYSTQAVLSKMEAVYEELLKKKGLSSGMFT